MTYGTEAQYYPANNAERGNSGPFVDTTVSDHQVENYESWRKAANRPPGRPMVRPHEWSRRCWGRVPGA